MVPFDGIGKIGIEEFTDGFNKTEKFVEELLIPKMKKLLFLQRKVKGVLSHWYLETISIFTLESVI
jgi:hypothetical protein